MADIRSSSAPHVNHRFILRVSSIAALGGVLYGYDMGIIAAAEIFVKRSFALTTVVEELVVSVVLIGAMIGAIVGGAVADQNRAPGDLGMGRGYLYRRFAAGSSGYERRGADFGARHYWPGNRFYIGHSASVRLRAGSSAVARHAHRAVPVHLDRRDCSGRSRRLPVGLTTGLEIDVRPRRGADRVLPACDSHRAGKSALAFRACDVRMMLRLCCSAIRTGKAHNSFWQTFKKDLRMPVEQRWSALWSPAVRGSLFVAVGLTVLQQVTGINTIIYYGPRIFALAGSASHSSAIFATLLVALVNVIATVVGITLVDRVGRKPLLYLGVSGMTVALFSLTYAFSHSATLGSSMGAVAIGCLMVYIACFAFSLGAIAWILVAEVFPLRVRGRGVAAATLGSGISNFAVSFTFLSLINAIGSARTFAIYGTLCIVTLIFVRFVVPETCGRDLESISLSQDA